MKESSSKRDESAQRALEGAKKACEIVGATFGPNGDNVGFTDQTGFSRTIRDGIRVLEQIRFQDKAQNLGVNILRDGSKKTAIIAGDGTTSTAMMAGMLIDRFQNYPGRFDFFDSQPYEDRIRSLATPVKTEDDLVNVATISANNRKDIGKIVGELVWKAGKDGVVGVMINGRQGIDTEMFEGYVNDGGATSPLFLQERRQLDLQDAFVVVVDQTIEHIDDITPILNQYTGIAHLGSPLVFVCHNMVGSALSTILHNFKDPNRNFPVYVVSAPNRDPAMRFEMLKDLADVIGVKRVLSNVGGDRVKQNVIDPDKIQKVLRQSHQGSPDEIKQKVVEKMILDAFIEEFGQSDVRIEGDRAIFIPKQMGGQARIEMLKEQLEKTEKGTNMAEALADRIARMRGAFGNIKIYGQTTTETSYLYELYDDAVRACFCAWKDGVVNGAGEIYSELCDINPNGIGEAIGKFLDRLDVDGNVVHPGEPVIEPATVPINVIRNSFSIAEQLLRTRYVIE